MSTDGEPQRPDHLIRLVRTLRDAEQRWREESLRLEAGLVEERARVERIRENNRQLTRTMSELQQQSDTLREDLAAERGRASELRAELAESRKRGAELEANQVEQEVNQEVLSARSEDLQGEVLRLEKELAAARAEARVQEEAHQRSLAQAREGFQSRERARDRRLIELERIVERLERGHGLKRMASLEMLLQTNEEALVRHEARNDELVAETTRLARALQDASQREEELLGELRDTQEGFRDAWRSAGDHADEILRLSARVEELEHAEAEWKVERSRLRMNDAQRLAEARRGLAEARLVEHALSEQVEAQLADLAADRQAKAELLAERATMLQAILQGQAALAALRDKLAVARRVQGASSRLGNLVCPPGADDERQDEENYPLVLELREAQRELRRAWAQVQEAEEELVTTEEALVDLEQGAAWVRQQQRLVDALEMQRDALHRALEDREGEMEDLERQLGTMELALAEKEEELAHAQELRDELRRERELTRTARLQRARLSTELRHLKEEHEVQVEALELERGEIRSAREELERLRSQLLEAEERCAKLQDEVELRHDENLRAKDATNTERVLRRRVEQDAVAALEEAEAERRRLEDELEARSREGADDEREGGPGSGPLRVLTGG